MNFARLLTLFSAIVASNTLLVAQGPPSNLPPQAHAALANNPSVVLNAPEINPALIGGALTLLVGGLLILTDSLRRKTRANAL